MGGITDLYGNPEGMVWEGANAQPLPAKEANPHCDVKFGLSSHGMAACSLIIAPAEPPSAGLTGVLL